MCRCTNAAIGAPEKKVLNHHPSHIIKALIEREQNGVLRKLTNDKPRIDFCSNDYLALACDPEIVQALAEGAARFGAVVRDRRTLTETARFEPARIDAVGAHEERFYGGGAALCLEAA